MGASHYRSKNTDRDHLSNRPFGLKMNRRATLWSIDMHRFPVSNNFRLGRTLAD